MTMVSESVAIRLRELRAKYHADLTEDILPFWLNHGLDRVNGGVYTCVDRDGSLIDTTKSVWFQGRCGYVFSSAYLTVEPRAEYLEMARSCVEFIENHCFDPADGRMYFEVAADGTPLRKRRYLFSECFAAIAMAEYSRAANRPEYARKALRLFADIIRFMDDPVLCPPKGLPAAAGRGHSLTMILINTAAVIRRALPDPILDERIDASVEQLRLFVKPEFKALLETVGPNGEFIDTINGRVINPGHCIETSWFLLEEARFRAESGADGVEPLRELALTVLDWSWDWGWDPLCGGIINFRDCRNLPPQDYSQDMKFWWPQTEAMIASLYAYMATGDERHIERHRMAHEWAYEHFADPEYGEWFGYLHRDGTVAQPAKGNIFKGPFHIPRMLVKSIELIDDLLAGKKF